MFLMFHVFTAIVIGVVLSLLLKDRRAVVWCAAGGLLPDLLDKALGHFAFYEVFGEEHRIYAHTLVFFGVLLIVGVVLFVQNRRHIALLCGAAGVLVHQAGDTMWTQATTWLWPLGGPLISSADIGVILSSSKTLIIGLCAAELLVFGLFYGMFLRKRDILMRGIACLVFVAAEAVTLFCTVILMHGGDLLFAGSGNWEYAFSIVLRETSMLSEWVFGVASLAMVLLVVLPEQRVIHGAAMGRICGAGCMVCGALYALLCSVYGGIDALYSADHRLWVVLALVAGGAVIFAGAGRMFARDAGGCKSV